jgi:hypothetical protein
MTTNDDPLARRALFVAFEGMGVLDLTGPLTVFWSASTFTTEGVTIETLPIAEFEGAAIDTVVVPGALDMEPALSN